ncbi:SLC45 family MFS transporter [Weissella diestrammenae]|uniref:SLC45 family MFS transporter n=1 Tax=Weissella diestrammenae TaxID=1162633 RepID=A0A7G9T469_9LACO|nr:SLC45 family MFS transporter [Weissella diestrammenae]MCM0583419.1 SLC45 family MFS transporter [Weissella diestrammenae]QNN74894.1 SLC45 family MFS transporter [Weissella diestrammenae]
MAEDGHVTAKSGGKKLLPTLAISTLMLMTFGNLGTSMAFSLQSANMGRIFQTLGADPTKLGFFFILPPLAGMIVQPLVGIFSDRTWIPKIGRRLPYLILGSFVAILVMCLLPNSGSFGFKTSTGLWFGAVAILFMDLSSNMSMQPFKMMISDMVNDEQKDMAWSWQTIWGNIGGVVANLFPFFFTAIGVANVAAAGQLPPSVKWAFYTGAFILAISAAFTVWKVDEYDPKTYAQYHGLEEKQEKLNLFQILAKAPKVFWTLGLVEFFCWAGFQYLWTYGTGTVAQNIWHTTNAASAGFQDAGNWFGILSAIETVAAIVWGLIITKLNNKIRKPAYSIGLVLGAIGFFMLATTHVKSLSAVAFIFLGIAWVTMNAIPFTILTNALDGKHDGTYMGLFNSWICLPQIVASVASFALYPLLGNYMPHMITVSGILFILGALAVWVIKETSVEHGDLG